MDVDLQVQQETDALMSFLGNVITEKKAAERACENRGTALSILMAADVNQGNQVMGWAELLTKRLGFGYVYIFKGTHQGICRYKIGKASRISDRRSIFAVKLPFDIELVAAFRVKNALKAESYIHKAQSANRVGGEWFDLDDTAFDAVCRQGVSIELADLADAIQENAHANATCDLMSDAEYIAHLECLLAMQGVSFSRKKNQ